MPLYYLVCSSCGESFTLSLSERERDSQKCPLCFSSLHYKGEKNSLAVHTFIPYYNWGLGKYVGSKSEVKEQLKKLGATEVGNG